MVGMLYVNSERLWGRINDLAQVGAIDGTLGCSRLALTDEDAEGRRLVITWMQDLGMDIAIDGIGNVVGTWYGPDTDRDLPAVMTGSHIDTVIYNSACGDDDGSSSASWFEGLTESSDGRAICQWLAFSQSIVEVFSLVWK